MQCFLLLYNDNFFTLNIMFATAYDIHIAKYGQELE